MLWCEYQIKSKDGPACGAHLNEGHCFKCPYKVENLYVESYDRVHRLKPRMPGTRDGGDGVCRDWTPPRPGTRPRAKLPVTEAIGEMLHNGQWERAAGAAACQCCGVELVEHTAIKDQGMVVDCGGRVWKL